MRTSRETARDDRILSATKVLSVVIVPFLVVAFVVLYPVPTETKQWFAWEIKPTMTPMVLGSAYLGGAYFFIRAWRATEWHTVKVGFIPVTLFASMLGIATIIHWDRFNHNHVAFWLWSGLYFTTPLLVLAVFLRNRRVESAPRSDELRLPEPARLVLGVTGLAALCFGVLLFVDPGSSTDLWPWVLSPLTGRVMGAVLMLGVAGIGMYFDPRWSTVRLMLQVERVMVALILLAAGRAHDEFFTGRPVTWMLGFGLLGVLIGSFVLDRTMCARTESRSLE